MNIEIQGCPFLLLIEISLYGSCGSRNYRRIGLRATDVKNGNAGPKLHWLVWEKSSFPALPRERYFLAENNSHDGNIRANFFSLTVYRLEQYFKSYSENAVLLP